MSNGKKLIRIGGRLIEVPLGEASQKKPQPPAATPSPPPVAPVAETSDPAPVIETPQEAIEEAPVKKPRRRRKKADEE
jgi:hypothetical protein